MNQNVAKCSKVNPAALFCSNYCLIPAPLFYYHQRVRRLCLDTVQLFLNCEHAYNLNCWLKPTIGAISEVDSSAASILYTVSSMVCCASQKAE